MNKTTVIIILLLFSLLFGLVFVSSKSVYAIGDPMTISQIASLAYGLGSSFGITFDMSGVSSVGANEYFQDKINSWLNGRTIIEAFGEESARLFAGKLILPAALYNGLKNFLEQFKDDNTLTPENKNVVLQSGNYRYYTDGVIDNSGFSRAKYIRYAISSGATRDYYGGEWETRRNMRNEGIIVENGTVYGVYSFDYSGGRTTDKSIIGTAGSNQISIGASFDGVIPETVLNPDEAWSGTLGGEDWPDTNLDELLGHIDDMVIDGTLDVEGEIVEPPVPPTPVPTIAPDIPLQDVPWQGLNDLIDSSTDTIGEGIQDQTDAITGAQEATTEAVESLTETIEGALDTPDSEELPDFKFDLRELFPFCIPFDIYRLLSSFDAEPQAPHVQLPIVIQSIGFNYTLDLDFSAWNPVAQAMRTAELIVYAIALAWATGKVIKW